MTDFNAFAEHARTALVEFHTKFEASNSVDTWHTMLAEEYQELGAAFGLYVTEPTVEDLAEVLKEACDVVYVMAGYANVAQVKGLRLDERFIDKVLAPVYAVIDVLGSDVVKEAFDRVHASNLSKLGDDGKPLRREDGKILKGPNYKPPVLTDLVGPAFSATNSQIITP